MRRAQRHNWPQLKPGRPLLPSPSRPLLPSHALVLNDKLILFWEVSVPWGAESLFSKKARVVSIPFSNVDWVSKEAGTRLKRERGWHCAARSTSTLCSNQFALTVAVGPYHHLTSTRSSAPPFSFCRKITAIAHVPIFPSQSHSLTLRRDSSGILLIKTTTGTFPDLKSSCAGGSVQWEHGYHPRSQGHRKAAGRSE